MGKEKEKALEMAMLHIEKTHGKGLVMRRGEMKRQDVLAISTGSLSLDIATGVGGLPRGRVVELYGPESAGKTTLALHVVAEAQKAGGNAVFIDAEHALDPDYAKALGVKVDELIISQPDSGDQALQICETLVRSGACDLVVIDSVAALTPRQEIDGDIGDTHVGLQARLMSQALRKLTSVVHQTNTTIVFINQIRMKIGVMFGNPETTPGGRALKFYSSIRLDIRRIETLKKGTESYGIRARVKVVKNKVAPPFRVAEFDIIYGEGISRVGDIIDMAVDQGIISRAGTWFSYGEQKLGQGRDSVRELLKADDALRSELEEKVMAKAFGMDDESAEAEGAATDDKPAEEVVVDKDTGEVLEQKKGRKEKSKAKT
jgi:recombination protein RecA